MKKTKFSDKNVQSHISEFIISSETNDNIKNDYLNYISKEMTKNRFIIFEITPMSDFGFFIQLIFDKTWVKIPINKDKKIFIKNNKALAFFDMYKLYSSIEINFNMEKCVSKKLKIYLKFELFEHKEDFNDMEININETEIDMDPLSLAYETPNRYNYDYKTKIKNFMCSANINIPDLPLYEEIFMGKKLIRALIGFYITEDENIISSPMEEEFFEDEDEDYEFLRKKKKKKKYFQKSKKVETKESIVHVIVTPSTNNIKRINLAPYNFYFSKTSLLEYEFQSEEIKIYNMDKINENDQNMIIIIHSCSGTYDIKISSKIVNYDDNQNDVYYQITKDEINKKYIYTIPNLHQKHIYVSIKPKIPKECDDSSKYINLYNDYDDTNKYNCSDELSYLINYYSGLQINIMDSAIKGNLRYRRENKIIWIKIPALKDYEYNIFWTKNSELFYKMDCICYLNQLASDIKKGKNEEIQYMQNIQLNENNEFPIEEKNQGQRIFVVVVSRNIKTNELSRFNPLIIPKEKGINFFIIFIYIAVLIGLYFYVRRLQNKSKFNINKKDYDDDFSEIEMKSQTNNRLGYSTLSKVDY